MNKIKRIFAILTVSAVGILPTVAEDVEFVAVMSNSGDEVSESIAESVVTRLNSAINAEGVVGGDETQFFIEAKFTTTYKQTIVTPTPQTVLTTTLNLTAGDYLTGKTYAKTAIDLKGVGTGDDRLYINALRTITPQNSKINSFIEDSKAKIMDYYNKEYQLILNKAQSAIDMKEYPRALYYLTSIPTWCKGYDKAREETYNVYCTYRDDKAKESLQQAKMAWATNPTDKGAEAAFSYLKDIPSDSPIFDNAEKLLEEISTKVASDSEFNLRDKYKDSVDLEKQAIESARAIGVAYGEGQKESTVVVGK